MMTADAAGTFEVLVTTDDVGTSGTDSSRYGREVAPSVAVVELVADRSGVDPMELPPLGSVLDTDALDALVCGSARSDRSVALSFPYAGMEVTVGGTDLAGGARR